MPKRALTHDALRKLFLALPGVEEAPCYGTPGFRVRKKLLARFHQDGESLVLVRDGRVLAQGATRDVLTPSMIRELYRVDADVAFHDRAGHLTVVPVARR